MSADRKQIGVDSGSPCLVDGSPDTDAATESTKIEGMVIPLAVQRAYSQSS
jgi:hypothetical protein